MTPVRICFVCLGNICRSPLAEALLRHKARERGIEDRLTIASRGTGDWHLGHRADARMRATASRHGVEIDGVSELFEYEDYEAFDLILTMDQLRQADLRAAAPARSVHRVRPFRHFDPEAKGDPDVPDPYYGGDEGFEEVYGIVDRTCEALLDRLEDGRWVEEVGDDGAGARTAD